MDAALRNMASVYITLNYKMLMLYRLGSRVVSPSWCGIGGHFEKDELYDAKAAMLRELYEEIGLKESNLNNIKLKYVTLRNINNEIRLNYYFFAELRANKPIQSQCDEGMLEWVKLSEILNREMPYTAKYVLEHYMDLGKNTNITYCGVATKDGVSFTELEKF